MKKRIVPPLSIFLLCLPLFAKPEGLSHPLKEPVFISGSFGEYRTFSRFHMGLDYKTFLQSGMPVYTPMGGVIRSVHVSEIHGYGNALFLRSPSGYDLTFAHLRDFSCPEGGQGASRLELFREALRVLVQDRPLRLRIPSYFRFRKGDCIAATGESGSGPPHLHFEIRKNRMFLDPLSRFGMKIRDTQPPVLLTLFIENKRGVFRFPLKKVAEVLPTTGIEGASKHTKAKAVLARYVLAKRLPHFSQNEPLRFMLGLYDNMASRNRNGVYGFSLEIGGRKVYERRLSRLALRELSSASQVYHTAFTQIGREYVYLFAPAQHPFYNPKRFLSINISRDSMPETGMSAQKGEARKRQALAIRFLVFDASGNRSELDVSLPLAAKADPVPPDQEGRVRLRPEVPFLRVRARGRLELRAERAGSRMRLQFRPGSVQLTGKVRLFAISRLPKEASEKLRLPIGPRRELQAAYKKKDSEPVFYIDGSDLYFRRGALGEAVFADSGTGKDGLYYYSYAKKLWLLVAHPYKKSGGRNFYRFLLRFTGPIAQLQDIAPPVQTAVFLWQEPKIFIKKNRALFREYSVREYGSGVDLPNTQVLLDGRPIPFRWGNDRSVIQVELPVSLLAHSGSLLSLRIADKAGNLSPWYFEWLSEPFRE